MPQALERAEDMKRIYEIIQDLKAAKGKNAKIEILKAADRKTSKLTEVLKWAYDPFITFGIKKWNVPSPAQISALTWRDIENDLLEPLSTRQLSGLAATSSVTAAFSRLDEYGQAVLTCILNKSFDAGIQASSVNKAFKGLIPTFDVMLAQPFKEKKLVFPCNAEIKFDGARALCFVKIPGNGLADVNFFTRSGKPILTMDHLKLDCEVLALAMCDVIGESLQDHGVVFDGEIMSADFQKTMQTFRRKDHDALDAFYHVFDWHFTDSWDARDFYRVQGSRRERLVSAFSTADINTDGEFSERGLLLLAPTFVVNSVAEVRALYTKVHDEGHEGLILKDPDALYERKRSWGWIKVKSDELPETVDLEVVGVQEGTGKYVGMLGALIVDFNGVDVRVGSGLLDEQRREFWLDSVAGPEIEVTYLVPNPVFGEPPVEKRALHPSGDVTPLARGPDNVVGSIIEVEYHEVTPDGSLRHPRFVKIRHDKSEV